MPKQDKPCPSCGHCPTCGHTPDAVKFVPMPVPYPTPPWSPYGYYPWQRPFQPYWSTTGGNTFVGDFGVYTSVGADPSATFAVNSN